MNLFYAFMLIVSIVPISTYCGHELLWNVIRGKYGIGALKVYLQEMKEDSMVYISYGIIIFSCFIASPLGILSDRQQMILMTLLSISFTVFVLRSNLLQYIARMYQDNKIIAHCMTTMKYTLILWYINIILHVVCIIYYIKTQL